ncbi:serine/threonine protein kinase, partial [Streptomyces sp. URMC 123]
PGPQPMAYPAAQPPTQPPGGGPGHGHAYGYPHAAPPGAYTTTPGYVLAPHPPAPPRRRTGPLLAAGALVMAVAGGAVTFAVLQSGGGDDDPRAGTRTDGRPAGTDGRQTPGTSASSPGSPGPSDSGAASPTGIPAEYLGTWEVRFGAGGTDIRRFTLRQGAVGETVFTMVAEGTSYRCEFSAPLSSVGPPVVLGPSTVTEGAAGTCRPGPTTTLQPTGDGRLTRVFSDSSKTLTYSRVS